MINRDPIGPTVPATVTQPGRLVCTVTILSAAILGFELSVMRLLLLSSWHHFAFLVISIALLGFGASGTMLCLWRSVLLRRYQTALLGLIVATAVAIPLCTWLAQQIPVEARFLPALWQRQLAAWLIYWLALTVPFFLGASAIGLTLLVAGNRVPLVYGANLLGSGIGAWLGTAAMSLLSPPWLAPAMGVLALLAAVPLKVKSSWTKAVGVTIGAIAIAANIWLAPPAIRLDPYKYGAYVQRLEQQGTAKRIAVAHSPRGSTEIYRGKVFHDMPFLAVGASPPAMDVLVIDGHWAGSVPRIRNAAEALAVDHTMMAFAYDVAKQQPRVLLLGERGGWNIWLALRNRAVSIDVVQPDPDLFGLLSAALANQGGQVFSQPAVGTIASDARHYVDHSRGLYDVIELVSLEGSAAGSGGIAGLGQDHLVTVEGITAALGRLNHQGLLFACRGIQTPPRDNLKLLATFIAALACKGVEQPSQHIVIVRDYLAVCTVVRTSPWTARQIEQVRQICQERQLTPVWFPGIRQDELNQPDVLFGPADSPGDWYHHGAVQLFSGHAHRFIDDWQFDIRPPTDDRPFFFDFFKASSIPVMRQTYGPLWLTRVEMGFLLVLAALVVIGLLGAALTVLPILCLGSVRACRGKSVTAIYFSAIGLAYLLLEVTALSKLTRLIGDPVQAAAATITAFLVASGLGSLTTQRFVAGRPAVMFRYAVVAMLLMSVVLWLGFDRLALVVGALPLAGRLAISMATIAPLAFLMGLPMPIGLHHLQGRTPALVPWAWGVNGFASVLAPPLATAIGMTWGFSTAGIAALVLYGVAAAVVVGLPSANQRNTDPSQA